MASLKHSLDAKTTSRVSALSQEQRRKKMLEKQKERRQNMLSKVRELAMMSTVDPLPDSDSVEEPTLQEGDAMIDQIPSQNQNPPKNKTQNQRYTSKEIESLYKNQLMIPELLEEIPIDLESNWLCCSVPEGIRCVVVSSSCTTIARTNDGKLLQKFQSYLPNGSQATREGRGDSYSLFDCVFVPSENTFYVIDMMCWRSHLYYDCDSEFRSFFFRSKFAEIPYISNISARNLYRFLPVPLFTCSRSDIEKALSPNIVGYNPSQFLFYAKEGHYSPEESPLFNYLPAERVALLLQQQNEQMAV